MSSAPRPADMSPEELRTHGRDVVERIASYFAHPERFPVLARVAPGDVLAALPAAPPELGASMEQILADFDTIVLPATTHWNHPGFMAYFATTGSGAGVLAEALIAALNANAMLWRTGPAATELEQLTLSWLRQMLGLPADFDGHINDTASTSTMVALAAAREAACVDVRVHGLAARSDVPRLVVYCSAEAHSSVDKAALTLGLGLANVRRIATDDAFRMHPASLAAAIAEDRAEGALPMAVVATVGTTGVTAVDPVPEIAAICAREGVWLHVDAAYGGAAAVVPELRGVLVGCELADSIVVNPHKWLFVPMDCSVLYARRHELVRRAFSMAAPDYLADGAAERNLMDFGLALGRRFRALKLWFVLRWFGTRGIADCIREHVRLAQLLARWIDDDPEYELLAPTTFSVVVFRHRPAAASAAELDAHNTRILEAVNASGEVFLSSTRVRGVLALRVAIGNARTTETHVARAWELVRAAASAAAARPIET